MSYLAMAAALLAATGCSTTMNWNSLTTAKEETELAVLSETNNLALLKHVYQHQTSGVTTSVETVRTFAKPTSADRVSDNPEVNRQCRDAFIKKKSQEGVGRNSRERFKCVILGALAWHAERHGETADDMPLDLMIYFNGGLNNEHEVLGTAFDSYQHVLKDDYYPIYMSWPTGVFDTYAEDVRHVRAGRYNSASWPPTTSDLPFLASIPARPFYDLLLGLAATPAAWSTSSTEAARIMFAHDSSGFRVSDDKDLLVITKDDTSQRLIDSDHNLVFGKEVDEATRRSRLSRAVDDVKYLGLFPSRLITTPLIGPGFALWRNMIRRTRTAFRSRKEFPNEDEIAQTTGEAVDCRLGYEASVRARQTCHPQGSGAFGQFFYWLDVCLVGYYDCPLIEEKDPEAFERLRATLKKLRLTLIGHSMGAIVINEALSTFPDLPYSKIVYMAGAASVRDSAEALSPVLSKNQGCTRFYNLMLHPLNDALERTAGGVLLSGSLLAYIDEYLEQPKTLPDRTIGQWRNLRLTRHLFPTEARRWSLYRVFDRQARRIPLAGGGTALDWNPITHGSFNDKNMPFWRESFHNPVDAAFDKPLPKCDDVFARTAKT